MGKIGIRFRFSALLACSSLFLDLGTSHASAFVSLVFLTQTNCDGLSLSISLHAKKTNTQKKSALKTKNKQISTTGFGGAAVENCPCGSAVGYMKCCGRLHRDVKAYADATAEQVVRARYSAYAKREVDFIVGSTHPLNKSFMGDVEHWKETIRMNCYDNFELTNCEIVDEMYEVEGEREVAKVRFVAKMIQVDSR